MRRLTALALAPMLGCGVLFNGTSAEVMVQTVPANGTITVDTEPGSSYRAPVSIELDRSDNHLLTATKPGHVTATASVVSKVDGIVIAADCLLGWCIPLIIDWPTGAVYRLRPESVTIVLDPEPTAADAPAAIPPP